MNKISIIVPVYNKKKYVFDCINSVKCQVYDDWELILVDDGSTDGSGKICDDCAEGEKIKVYHIVNSGVTFARGFGVRMSTGDWITFLDGDDTLPNDSLCNLVRFASERTDIILGSVNNIYSQFPDGLSVKDYRCKAIKGWHIHTGPVAKLFRRSLFDSAIFDIPREIVFGEDMIMNIRIAFRNQKHVTISPYIVYNYNLNTQSQTCNFKITEEYESIFNRYWIASIPENDREEYAEDIFRKLYDSFFQRLKNNWISNWRNYRTFESIVKVVEQYHIKLSVKERLSLYLKPLWIANIYVKTVL